MGGTLVWRDTSRRAAMPPGSEARALHGMHSSHHASYGFLENSCASERPMPPIRLHSQIKGQSARRVSV